MSNPGFEAGLAGWRAGTSRTTLARTCSVTHGGSCSAALGRTKSSGDVLLDDSPDTVASTIAGATYAASAWVRAPAGRTVILRIRESSGGSVVRSKTATVTGNGSWRQLSLTTATATGGTTLSVEVVLSVSRGSQAYVDDVSLQRSS